ncbi:SulP family inorganic anion transporter [Agromyces italicus]|uniref:SulP family inorganic anion transporter n=1 Tax=Agromyces italicus TaxID=279572 RepID=UPI0003B2E622|nr:SulP family inorganic anion transporter [Agromyces italicus]
MSDATGGTGSEDPAAEPEGTTPAAPEARVEPATRRRVPGWLRRYLARFGTRCTVLADARAGLVLGVESIPDGLASGVLAGVNPVYGLYGYLFGTLGGALATGSVFMSVQATGAMSVMIADVPAVVGADDQGVAIATLAMLTGVVMLALGLANLGSLVRFIPTAVLVGFMNAVAVNIVLGQLTNLTGYDAEGANRLTRTFDTVFHLTALHWPSVIVGAITVGVILLLERTFLGALAMVVAVVVASALPLIPWFGEVALVGDLTEVPNSLPLPGLPDLALVLELAVPALSLALVGLVQGAAISSGIANPDGRFPDASADFRGQGIANLTSGLFQGLPVGGSMSATAIVRSAGARSALGNLVAAVVMIIGILTLGGLIGSVAMPALAGLLILVGVRTFKPHDLVMVWRTGPIQSSVVAVTFVLTLIVPLQYAVLVGVGLAVVLHVARQSNRVVIRRWVYDDSSPHPAETDPPATLAPGEVVVLVPYGSLFFAAAPVFARQLPEIPERCDRAVVVLRMRGTDELGSTFIRVVTDYAERLRRAGGALILVGLGDRVMTQLDATRASVVIGRDRVFAATPRIGDSLDAGLAAARAFAADAPER